MLRVQLPPIPQDNNFPHLHVSSPTPNREHREHEGTLDPYRDHVRRVLGTLIDPPGLDQWLGARSDLLSGGRVLIRCIDAAWGGPLHKFDRELEKLAAFHRQLCTQYQTRLQKPAQGVLEGPQDVDTEGRA
jgi:hypothetical protein